MNINITKEQIEILNEKAQEAGVKTQELLDMIIEFFTTMPKNDIKFFISSLSGEHEGDSCCSQESCSTNDKEEDSCCGGECH